MEKLCTHRDLSIAHVFCLKYQEFFQNFSKKFLEILKYLLNALRLLKNNNIFGILVKRRFLRYFQIFFYSKGEGEREVSEKL